MKVIENLQAIQENILQACVKSNRNPSEVRVIAVTKYVSIDRAKEAIEAGILDLGENYDEGLIAKWEVLQDKPTWHFIGSLQTRKVRNIIDKVDYIHSLDRPSLAKEINKRANKRMKCLVQVNVSGEESKHGLAPQEVINFIKTIQDYPNIEVAGLMTMAPHTDDQSILRHCFSTLKSLQIEVQQMKLEYAPCTELSMGMSNDYAIAVEEGATLVRIGTALVGEEM
jgi:pyridoxal phosphate enzyme (YggS family)